MHLDRLVLIELLFARLPTAEREVVMHAVGMASEVRPGLAKTDDLRGGIPVSSRSSRTAASSGRSPASVAPPIVPMATIPAP